MPAFASSTGISSSICRQPVRQGLTNRSNGLRKCQAAGPAIRTLQDLLASILSEGVALRTRGYPEGRAMRHLAGIPSRTGVGFGGTTLGPKSDLASHFRSQAAQ